MNSYAKRAVQYAGKMVSGEVPAGRYAVLAAKRFLADIDRRRWQYVFNPDRVELVCRFVELFPHVKGEWAVLPGVQKLIKLADPWVFVIANLHGFYDKTTGLRRFQDASIYIPRKNAKSVMAAGLGLWALAGDNEPGAEVYCGATSEKQAWEVFRPAKLMISAAHDICTMYGISVNAKSIVRQSDLSRFEPIIGKPGDGAMPHFSVADEYHEHDTNELVSTMETGMGARRQPISLKVSTAGDNIGGPCHDDVGMCRLLLDGVVSDERKFAIIWEADADKDWSDLRTIVEANPMIDISVKRDFLVRQRDQALTSARHQNTFRIKHLNQWVGSRAGFFNLSDWDAGTREVKLADFAGWECYIAGDLASKIDLASLNLIFQKDGEYITFGIHYLPEATINEPSNEHYRAFQARGALRMCDGEQIDFDEIEEDILELCRTFKVVAVAFDPHQGPMLMTRLQKKGVPVVEFTQNAVNYTPPMREAEGCLRAGKVKHNGDPVLRWAIGNVTAREDAKQQVFPRKERRENKIDPAVAFLMALAMAMQTDKSEDAQLRQMLASEEPAYI